MESLQNISNYLENTPISSSFLPTKHAGSHYGRYEFLTSRPEISIFIVVVLVFATLIGTVGNITTILVFATRKHLRKVENIFMINLVISDLYVTSVADPMSIVGKYDLH